MKRIIGLSVFFTFLLVASVPLFGIDPVVNPPKTDRDPEAVSCPPGYAYAPLKTKEEIAFELFSRALGTVPELKLQQNYDQYLEAYRKALRAVYGRGQ